MRKLVAKGILFGLMLTCVGLFHPVGVSAHTHTDDCYDIHRMVACDKINDKKHKHNSTCYVTAKILKCTIGIEDQIRKDDPNKTITAPYGDVAKNADFHDHGEYDDDPDGQAFRNVNKDGNDIQNNEDGDHSGSNNGTQDKESAGDSKGSSSGSDSSGGYGSSESSEGFSYSEDESDSGYGESSKEGKISGKGEHIHTDACYTNARVLTCDKDHAHTDECYKTVRVLTCEEKTDDAKVLTCTETDENHIHNEDCFEDVTWVCKEDLQNHAHDASCFTDEPVNQTVPSILKWVLLAVGTIIIVSVAGVLIYKKKNQE